MLIEPGRDARTHDESFEQEQSGLTIALSGAAGSAVNSAVTTAQSVSDESDDRLAALKIAQGVMSGVSTGQAMELAMLPRRLVSAPRWGRSRPNPRATADRTPLRAAR